MVYLLRHGEDDETYIGGHSNVGLTEDGKMQVKEALKLLKTVPYRIDKIVSSDIYRAVQTAKIVNEQFNLPITYTEELRELDKGKLNGMLLSEAKIIYPNFVGIEDINLTYPNGESMIQFYKRIKLLLNKIMLMDNTLIITHRGVINMIYFILNNVPLNMNKTQFGVTHASLHELDLFSKKIKKIG
jgi:broad specificity phosphatase PhoE